MEKSILIAEDDLSLAEALKYQFEELGFTVIHVQNGTEALRILTSQSIDIALLDRLMPEIDGFGVYEKLQSEGSATKVILMSNLTNEEFGQKAEEYGVPYLKKWQASVQDIVELVEHTLEN